MGTTSDGALLLPAGTPEGWGLAVVGGTGSIVSGKTTDGRTARGGGWGPMVAGTLLGGGGAPRRMIGSTNAAEFFVTLTIAATFLGTIGLDLWPVITGLVIGGVLAAPLAAVVAKHLPPRLLMVIVGCVIALLALRGLGRQAGFL